MKKIILILSITLLTLSSCDWYGGKSTHTVKVIDINGDTIVFDEFAGHNHMYKITKQNTK